MQDGGIERPMTQERINVVVFRELEFQAKRLIAMAEIIDDLQNRVAAIENINVGIIDGL